SHGPLANVGAQPPGRRGGASLPVSLTRAGSAAAGWILLMASMVTSRSLSPMVVAIAAEAGPNVGVSAGARGAGNHDPGSGPPVTTEANRHAALHPTAPILRWRRPARQEPVQPPARKGRGPDLVKRFGAARPERADAVA